MMGRHVHHTLDGDSLALLEDCPMRFAKDCFDIGLMVPADQFDLSQWSAIAGLHLDHVLNIASYQQHRFHCGDAVLKVNVGHAPPAPDSPTGLVAFRIGAQTYAIRDGAPVVVEVENPRSTRPPALDIIIETPSVATMMQFYIDAFGLAEAGPQAVQFGPARLVFRSSPTAVNPPPLDGTGIRYLTFQVFDADRACEEAIAKGARLGREPVSFGDVARFGFVLDPDGNWIELSARASILARHQA